MGQPMWPYVPDFPGQSRFLRGRPGKNTGSPETLKCPGFRPPVPIFFPVCCPLIVQVISSSHSSWFLHIFVVSVIGNSHPAVNPMTWKGGKMSTLQLHRRVHLLAHFNSQNITYVCKHFEIGRVLPGTWTSEITQMRVDTLRSVLVRKTNFSMSCIEIYDTLVTDRRLIEGHSSVTEV